MADVNTQLAIIIKAQDEASSQIKKISESVTQLGQEGEKGFGAAASGAGVLKGALLELAPFLAIGAVIGEAFSFAKSSLEAFSDSQSKVAQLNAVLKSTGGVAGETTEDLIKLSEQIQNTSTFSDEAALSVENMLLTFTNIHKDVFPLATQAVVDMSVAMGTDLVNQSIQVGKALNDPINGVQALQRVGVKLTDQQSDLVKQMVETGRGAEAQKIIIDELMREFGGSALAQLNTFSGAWAHLTNVFDSFQEKVGGVIAAGLQQVISLMGQWVNDLNSAWDNLQAMWDNNTNGIRDKTIAAFQWLLENVLPVWDAFRAAALEIWGYIVAIWQVHGQTILNILKDAFSGIAIILTDGFKIVGNIFRISTDVLNGNWSDLWLVMQDIVKNAWNGIVNIAASGARVLQDGINLVTEGINKVAGTNIPKLNIDTSVLDQFKAKVSDTAAATKISAFDIGSALDSIFKSVPTVNIGSGVSGESNFAKGSDSASGMKNKLKDLSDAYKDFGQEAQKQLTDLEVAHNTKIKSIDEKLTDLTQQYNVASRQGAIAMDNLRQQNQNALSGIDKSISDTTAKIKELQQAFNDTANEDSNNLAKQIIDTQNNIEDAKSKLRNTTDQREIGNLQARIDKEQATLNDNADFIKSMQGTVDAERRRSQQTDLQRAINDFNSKRTLAKQQFDEKMNELQQEILVQQQKRIQETTDFNAKVVEFQLELKEKLAKIAQEKAAQEKARDDEVKLYAAKIKTINDAIAEGEKFRQTQTENTKKLTLDAVNAEIAAYDRLTASIKAAASASSTFSFGLGGRYGGGRAIGGSVDSGTTYLVGENGPELFTPTNSGNITPNEALGAGGGSLTINISGNTLLDTFAAEKIGNMIVKKLQLKNRLGT